MKCHTQNLEPNSSQECRKRIMLLFGFSSAISTGGLLSTQIIQMHVFHLQMSKAVV